MLAVHEALEAEVAENVALLLHLPYYAVAIFKFPFSLQIHLKEFLRGDGLRFLY